MDEYVRQARRRPPRAPLGPRRGDRSGPQARPGPRRRGGDVVRRHGGGLPLRRRRRTAYAVRWRPAGRPPRALRAGCGVGPGARGFHRVRRGVRARRRRGDHVAHDRRLRLRGHGARAGRHTARGGGRRALGVGVALHRDGQPALLGRGVLRRRRPRGAALALLLGRPRRLTRARPRRRRRAPARRQGVREGSPTSRADAQPRGQAPGVPGPAESDVGSG